MSERIRIGREIEPEKRYRTKVCIIGTGCGGATLGAKLAESGVDVLLLERGGFYPTSSFDNHELNMGGKVSAERNMDTTEDAGISLVYGQNIGGASVHYWADSYRTPDDRLEYWQSEFGMEGHRPEDLYPYWELLDKTHNVHPAKDEYFNGMNLVFRKAAQDLGWKGDRVPQARKNCQKSGHCMQGCAFAAKQSQLVTNIPKILELGGRIFADSEAEKLEIEGERVRRLKVSIRDRQTNRKSGRHFYVEADIFVVAAGGFRSSAFLLQNDLDSALPFLGKGLAINPSPFLHALYDHEIIQWRNIPAAYGVEEFRLAKFAKGKYTEGGYLLMPNQLQPATLAALMPGFGNSHAEWMEKLPYLGGTTGWIDDPADELGEIHLDAFGNPRVSYTPGKIASQIIIDLIKKMSKLNFAAGAKKVLLPDLKGTVLDSPKDMAKIDGLSVRPGTLGFAAPHPAGGCRMGSDSKTSVVGFDHKVHGIDNLYVSDSSVFPTGVSVDPSYTIMAFSHIAGERILEKLNFS